MKINEVEAQVGITKKNIRFYEEQGLLTPRRNSENGYRDYGPGEVDALRRIKLMRKLGVPIDDIRKMLLGERTVGAGLRRHLQALEAQRRGLEEAQRLCQRLKDVDCSLSELDAGALLEEMERLEEGGAAFLDRQRQDASAIRYVAPVVVTVLTGVAMGGLMALFLWAWLSDPADAPPLPLLAVLMCIPGVVILGVVLALIQRIREIGRGEEEDARKY